MKSKTIIISLLLFLLIVGATVGKIYIPIGLYIVSILVVILCLVFYVLKLLVNEKMYFENKYQNLSANIDSTKNEILQKQTTCKEQIIDEIVGKQLLINQLITQGLDSINENSTKRTNSVIEFLSTQSKNIDDKFKKEVEFLDSLSEKAQSLSAEISNKITNDSAKIASIINKTAEQIKNEEECTRKTIEDASNNILSLLNSQREVIENAVDTATNLVVQILQEHKDTLITSVSELSSIEISSRETLAISLSNVLQKNRELKELIENTHESVANVINNRGNEITNNITKCIVDSICVVSDSISKTQISLTESTDSLLQKIKIQSDNVNNILSTIEKNEILKEIVTSSVAKLVDILNAAKLQTDDIIKNVEFVKLQNSTLQESIVTNNELIANSENAVVASTNQHKTEIVEVVLQNSSNISSSIEQSVSKALTTLTNNIDQAKAFNITTEETLLQSNKEQTDVIYSAITKLQESVVEIAKSNNENAEILSGSMADMTNIFSNKIDSVENQNQVLVSDIKEFNDVHKENSNALQLISNQFNLLEKGLIGVQIKSNNVENLVNEFTKKNSNSVVIDSIKSMIAELRKELASLVSDINDEIQETQINQKSTHDEIDKLIILLRNISKESIQDANVDRKPSEDQRTHSTATSSTNGAVQQDRTETIIDNETKNIVHNQFVNGKLSKSTMKNKNGLIIYELEFKGEKIFRSRNYDAKGVMNIEQVYYDNGQVHYRNEKTIKGNISTEFDRNGNKK